MVAVWQGYGEVSAAFTRSTSNPASGFTAAASFYEGALYGWGDNTTGNLGLGDTTSPRTSPLQVGAVTTWTEIDTGNTSGYDSDTGHSCATRSDGTLWCWGRNVYGQLGRGNTTDSSSPVQIGAATDWVTLNSGSYHTCAIKTTGTLWCHGDNASAPVQLTGTGWDSVSVGRRHACAVKTAGTLWCWGLNASGQLGKGDTTTRQTPAQVGALTTWDSVGAFDDHTCAIKTDATLWCWGSSATYQVGQGNTTQQNSPVQVGSATWIKVAGGEDYTCGTQTDRSLWCWGDNAEGSLGQGNTTTKTTPTQVPGLTGRVFAGGNSANATFAIS
jgi:alpha-tubulin suppressor-like RCC1 family protein